MSPPIDNAHTHVRALKSDVGAGYVSVCATGPGDWDEVAQAAQNSPGQIIPSFGLHPWMINPDVPFDRNALIPYLEQFPGAGIGEIGLDKSRHCRIPVDGQKNILKEHIRLALDYERVITLHCVRAWGGLLEVLKQTRPPRFLIHGWNADESLLPSFIGLGAFFSLNKRSLSSINLSSFLSTVPASRLLLETDDEESGLDELFNDLQARSHGEITRQLLHDNFTGLFFSGSRISEA